MRVELTITRKVEQTGTAIVEIDKDEFDEWSGGDTDVTYAEFVEAVPDWSSHLTNVSWGTDYVDYETIVSSREA